jgi:ribosomal protein L3 glutamine methyltransferase
LTLRRLVREVEVRLRRARLHFGHGTANARDEAAFLVLRGLSLPFDAPADRPVAAREQARIERLLARRVRDRIPVAYLLNEAWLTDERFYVDRRVIIPRSHLADMLAQRARPWLARSPRRVLDLCTGSGCLAVLAAKAWPRARVDASDLSPGALAVARRNLAMHQVSGRVRLVRSDLFAKLRGARYDLIISNPPYVTAASMRALPREYGHEPHMALAGGNDGLDFVRRLLREAPAHLTPGGLLICEVGAGRTALQRAHPSLPFTWAQEGTVFLLTREELG